MARRCRRWDRRSHYCWGHTFRHCSTARSRTSRRNGPLAASQTWHLVASQAVATQVFPHTLAFGQQTPVDAGALPGHARRDAAALAKVLDVYVTPGTRYLYRTWWLSSRGSTRRHNRASRSGSRCRRRPSCRSGTHTDTFRGLRPVRRCSCRRTCLCRGFAQTGRPGTHRSRSTVLAGRPRRTCSARGRRPGTWSRRRPLPGRCCRRRGLRSRSRHR